MRLRALLCCWLIVAATLPAAAHAADPFPLPPAPASCASTFDASTANAMMAAQLQQPSAGEPAPSQQCQSAAAQLAYCCTEPYRHADCGVPPVADWVAAAGFHADLQDAVAATNGEARLATAAYGGEHSCRQSFARTRSACTANPSVVAVAYMLASVNVSCQHDTGPWRESEIGVSTMSGALVGIAAFFYCENPPAAKFFRTCAAFPTLKDTTHELKTVADCAAVPNAAAVQLDISGKDAEALCSGASWGDYILTAGHCLANALRVAAIQFDARGKKSVAAVGRIASVYETVGATEKSAANVDFALLRSPTHHGGLVAASEPSLEGPQCVPSGTNPDSLLLCSDECLDQVRDVTLIDFPGGQPAPRSLSGYCTFDAINRQFHCETTDTPGSSGAPVYASICGHQNVIVGVISGGPQVGESDLPVIPYDRIEAMLK
jgi:V8-like Glu-specific endopeptidase